MAGIAAYVFTNLEKRITNIINLLVMDSRPMPKSIPVLSRFFSFHYIYHLEKPESEEIAFFKF